MNNLNNRIIGLLFLMAVCPLYAQTKNIAFVGQAATYSDNIPGADAGLTYDDDRAAAVWFMEDFVVNNTNINGTYLSFEDVAAGSVLSGYDAIWVQSDGATFSGRMDEWPRGTVEDTGEIHCILGEGGFQWNGNCTALQDDFISNIKSYYLAGGNLFLGNYASKGLEVFGVFDGLINPWEYKPNQTFGETSPITDSWAVDNPWGNLYHGETNNPIMNGFSLGSPDGGCNNGIYIEFLAAGPGKKNRTCQYNFDWGRINDDANTANGGSATLAQKYDEFETVLNAEILLTNCGGNEVQAVQFNPRNTGNGTVIINGGGSYDWYAGGSPTNYNNNIKLFTSNALLTLAGVTLSTKKIDKSQISFYPNPVQSKLYINYKGKLNTSIYNLLGNQVLVSNSKTIDISELAVGMYIIKAIDMSTKESMNYKILVK